MLFSLDRLLAQTLLHLPRLGRQPISSKVKIDASSVASFMKEQMQMMKAVQQHLEQQKPMQPALQDASAEEAAVGFDSDEEREKPRD